MEQKNVFSEVLSTVTKYFTVAVIVMVIGILCSGIRIVENGNVAVILRCGKVVGNTYEEKVHGPGLLLAFPYVIDEVVMVPTGSVIEQNVYTYFTDETGYAPYTYAYLITGDQNIATLSASVKYVVSDPVAYALHVKDVQLIINACVSNAMLTEAASTDVDALLTNGQDRFAAAALHRASEKIAQSGIGVELTTLELTQVRMALEVREKYNEVNAATVEAATMLENAESYRITLLPDAQAKASQMVSQANSDKSAAIAQANAYLAEFRGLLEEYRANPLLVRTRLYNQKVTQMLGAIGTVRIVQDGETKIFLNP